MIPLLVNIPEPMLKVRVLALKTLTEALLERLQAMGGLHVEVSRELSPADHTRIEEEQGLIRTLLAQIEDLLAPLQSLREVEIPTPARTQPLETLAQKIGQWHAQAEFLKNEQRRLKEQLRTQDELTRALGVLASRIDRPLADLAYRGDYLFSAVATLPAESVAGLSARLEGALLQEITAGEGDECVLGLVARTSEQVRIREALGELGGAVLAVPESTLSLKSFLAQAGDARQGLVRELAQIDQAIERGLEEHLTEVAAMREALQNREEQLRVLSLAGEARFLRVVEGWVPVSGVAGLEGLTDLGSLVVDRRAVQPGEDAPTKLDNPPLLRPFEVIVKLFSVPRYGQWDPTPAVAYFFAFFFGLMLNDIVYALGLLLLARFLLDHLVDDPHTEGVQLFRRVLYTSGVVSLIFGGLSGVYLGDFMNRYLGLPVESLALVSGVQRSLSDPITFIILALVVGVVHVNIAHLLALIQGLHERRWGVPVNKAGLFLTELAGIPYLLKALLNIELLPLSAAAYQALAYPLLGGVALIIIGTLLTMGPLGAIFWIFDLTGILGDVMSYSRLAGVGLATYYLASSFNLLAGWFGAALGGMLPGILGTTVSFVVGCVLLVVLHTFNLLLSSLAAFIHSLRLCFVEYLMKFYEGGGREYAPFCIRSSTRVTLGGV